MGRVAALSGIIIVLLVVEGCGPATHSGQGAAPTQLVRIGEWYDQIVLGKRMRTLLGGERFDRLEAIADSLERNDARWPSGSSVLTSFYEKGFGTVNDPGSAPLWEEHLSRLRKWVEARPASVVARFALAEAHIGRGWAARGTDWADNVPHSHWRRFGADLAAAGDILDRIPMPDRAGYEWHSAMMKVLHGIGSEGDSAYRLVARDALERFPVQPRFYTGVAGHLMPRWYGSPGEWQAFARSAVGTLPDSLADEFYARIVLAQAKVVENVFEDGGPVDWPRVQRGLDRWQRRWPAASQPRGGRALLGWMAGDRATSRAAFESLGDSCDLEVWDTPRRFLFARQWAMRSQN